MDNIESRLLTITQACKYLGISHPTFWRLRKDGKVKAVKLGKTDRFTKENLEECISNNTFPKRIGKI
jgi:excisionase family DNA binding protein